MAHIAHLMVNPPHRVRSQIRGPYRAQRPSGLSSPAQRAGSNGNQTMRANGPTVYCDRWAGHMPQSHDPFPNLLPDNCELSRRTVVLSNRTIPNVIRERVRTDTTFDRRVAQYDLSR
jgi:hypothetical protein